MMLNFKSFLKEEAEFGKLKHLEHAEDHIIHPTEHGVHNAINILDQAHQHITKGVSDSKVKTKWDGSPSVVFGHHPQTGKFFVATKSAFNKNPKINYTPEDIEKNHGDKPGLAAKLKHALKHLPKVAPKKGVYQGDLMHSEGDVKGGKSSASFTPNTITYTTHGEEAKKAKASKIGIAVHTKYHGSHLENMNAGFDPDLHKFKHHPDVHMLSSDVDTGKIHHSPEAEANYQHHMEAAKETLKKAPHDTFEVTHPHAEHLKTYINSTVKTGETPSTEGFKKHIEQKLTNKAKDIKTEKKKIEKRAEIESHLRHINDHKEHYNSLFKIHHHLQQAKDALVSSLETGSEYNHSVGKEKTGPEGFVITHHGHPTKLVKRKEFSKFNFIKSAK